MSNPSVSSAPADARSYGPSRFDLISVLNKEISVCIMNKEYAADQFTDCYADGLGICESAIDDYRHFSSLVVTYRLRLSQLVH